MRIGWLLLMAALGSAGSPPTAAARAGYTRGVANAALVAAAKSTPLKLIDYDEDLCRNDRTVEAWLKELTGHAARKIVWSGGPCALANTLNPMDSGSAWCAQVRIHLKRPKDRTDRPVIEIYFDKPTHGRPSPAYAFRAIIEDVGLLRFRREFEDEWLARFPATAASIRCPQGD